MSSIASHKLWWSSAIEDIFASKASFVLYLDERCRDISVLLKALNLLLTDEVANMNQIV
jgi:hypothetical protein